MVLEVRTVVWNLSFRCEGLNLRCCEHRTLASEVLSERYDRVLGTLRWGVWPAFGP